MSKAKIIFRADGNSEIGMGHIFRALAIADMVKDYFICEFVTRFQNTNITTEINKICSKIHFLPEDEQNHFTNFLNLLTGNEIVVLDNYFFETIHQKQIKALGCKLVCIDDKHDKHYVADIVINHAGGINKEYFSLEKNTRLFLGFKYALIRNTFLKPMESQVKKRYSCLIMIGATDPFKITEKIIAFLELQNLPLPIAVVLGSTNNSKIDSSKDVHIFKELTAEEVKAVMSESEFGIIPASTTAMEACSQRLPFITGYYVDNQLNLYNYLNDKELACCIDDFLKLNLDTFNQAIKKITDMKFSNRLQKNQKRIFDNKSNERIVKIFLEL